MIIPGTGAQRGVSNRPGARRWMLPALALTAVALFLAAPWPFETKAHMALHGLCAQRPSHSFTLGDRTLPFDARMTGIYGGFLVAAGYLLARGRLRAFRLPPLATMVVLGLFVAVLAVDGTNSLLVDLRAPHPYTPDNLYRLATGLLTGIVLAVILCFVLGTTLWRHGRPEQPVVGGLGEVALLVALQAPFVLLVASGAAWLYVPISLLLLVSATIVVGALVLMAVVLVRHGDRVFTSADQVQVPAAVALVLGMAVMGAIAAARFILERLTNTPPLT